MFETPEGKGSPSRLVTGSTAMSGFLRESHPSDMRGYGHGREGNNLSRCRR